VLNDSNLFLYALYACWISKIGLFGGFNKTLEGIRTQWRAYCILHDTTTCTRSIKIQDGKKTMGEWKAKMSGISKKRTEDAVIFRGMPKSVSTNIRTFTGLLRTLSSTIILLDVHLAGK